MIFLRYESFQSYIRTFPVTVTLIVLNIVYFIFLAFMGNPNESLFAIEYGAFVAVPGVDTFGFAEPWRYWSSIFMHASVDHLLYNMFALLIFAPPLERLLHSTKYAIFYLLCGAGGNFLSAFINNIEHDRIHVAVGASGAIYGIYGAYLFLALFRKHYLDESSRKTIYIILAFGVVYSILMTGVDLWGHVGGAITGLLLYSIFEKKKVR